MFTRRDALLGAMALSACAPSEPVSVAAFPPPNDERFAAIERRIGGRVGVAAFDTGASAWLVHRPQERFAMASTFKWLLAAQLLYMDMHMPGFREQRVLFRENDLLEHAPATRARIGPNGVGEMTIEELCEAAVVVSDNTAANLLLIGAGGPAGFTNFVRANGDAVTRLDRAEPELNENAPGDERDSTTPVAMAFTLQRFLLGEDVLNPASRERLTGWMIACRTGLARLRAGLPANWRAGDKTGTGGNNAVNDVAIAWPPNRAPIIIAAYLSESAASRDALDGAHAEIARIVAETWG
jgi:beta-lactamase class A